MKHPQFHASACTPKHRQCSEAFAVLSRRSRRLCLALLALACTALPVTTFASRIVYLAEQDTAYVNELYLVDLDAPGITIKLNRSLPFAAYGVGSFAISPDGTRIVFTADQTVSGALDLYLVDLAALGTWTRLGSLGADRQEMFPRFSPDGNKVAFTASDENFANVQLYVVDLADPTDAIRLNPDLVTDGAVSMTGFEFTPDSSRIVYGASQDESRFDLYVVDLGLPGQTTKLNGPGGGVGNRFESRFSITSGGERVVYSAVGNIPGMRELHVVTLEEPGPPIALNAALQSAGDIFDFTLSPDGRFVAYVADQETDEVLEAYLVKIAAPGIATKINGPVQSGATLAQFTPDGSGILYVSDQDRGPFERDLYIVDVDQPAEPVRLNAPLDQDVSVRRYVVSPDGARVAYVVEPFSGFAKDLMIVELASPGTAVKVNAPLPNGALEWALPKFSPGGHEIAFLAVESVNESIQELFFAMPSAPGVSTRLNGPLPPEGIVAATPDSFAFLPADAPLTRAPSPETKSSGGGSTGVFTVLLLAAAVVARRGRQLVAGLLRPCSDLRKIKAAWYAGCCSRYFLGLYWISSEAIGG